MIRLTLLGLFLTITTVTCFAQQNGSFKDPRDGRVYKTVKIGDQEWMAENLNADRFRNGDQIPKAKSMKQWRELCSLGSPAWCYLNFDDNNSNIYGKYYNWYAATDPRGIAPEEWRVPKAKDWINLINPEIKLNILVYKYFHTFGGYLYDGDAPPWFVDRNKIAYFWSSNTFKNKAVGEVDFDFDDDDSYIVFVKKEYVSPNILEFNYCSTTHGIYIRCLKD